MQGQQLKEWELKLFPPYAMQVVDGVVANLADDRIRWMVRAQPRMADPEEQRRMHEGAKALELLLSHELDRDSYSKKRRNHIMQACIKGISVRKNSWTTEIGLRRSLDTQPTFDGQGYIDGSQHVETSGEEVTRDDPTTEVVRMEDFLWEEAAVELQKSTWVIHRVAASMEELKALQKQGIYRNVDELKSEKDGKGFSDEFSALDDELARDRRWKDRVEVLEFWTKEDGRLRTITVGNRRVLLADRRDLFHHGLYPFTVLTPSPDSFRIPGLSIVEKMIDLQQMLWTLASQRLTNLQLLNNFIVAYRDDLVNRDDFEFYPGAAWPVQGDVNTAIQQFKPDPTVGRIALEAEAVLKGDIQNITGGMPFMAGVAQQSLDQKTATGVSIVTTIAQRMVAAQKQQVAWDDEETAAQWISLLQQFMREPRLVSIVGEEGARAFKEVFPTDIQGDYHVNVDPVGETLMVQERRAAAQAKLQMAAQVAPVMAAIAQAKAGAGLPAKTINLEAYVEDYLREFEVDDTERYFSAVPQPQVAQGGQPNPAAGPGGGGQPGESGPPLGVTAPTAADAASPSNQTSLSGAQFMQRALAMRGGIANGGQGGG